MPVAPRKVCRRPGCKKLAEKGSLCEQHQASAVIEKKVEQKKYDNERGSKHERGYTSKWSRFSLKYRKEHPFCVMCHKNGRLVIAQCVDHIEPVSGPEDERFFDETNLQGLCLVHHAQKTAIDGSRDYV